MENNFIPEQKLPNIPKAISSEVMENILKQIKSKSICKIKKDNGSFGTGFFAKIPFPDSLTYLRVLMTNNHIIEDNMNNKYEIFFPKTKYYEFKTLKLSFDDSRRFYTNKKYDTTIIEIKEGDGIDLESFLEIDYENNNKIEDYKQESIYVLQYPNDKNVDFSMGVIKDIELDNNYTIEHLSDTQAGSSGSPILKVLNYKVVGIHRGYCKSPNCNLGTLIKFPIEDFNIKMRTKSFEEIFQEIRDKKLDILFEINSKKELLYLFIAVNNKFFHKKYFGEIFFTFLKENESIIQVYFGEGIIYDELYKYFFDMNLEKEEKQKNESFEIIKKDINNKTDKLYNIIGSFYFLIMYKFKDSKQFREYSNIGNAYLNIILQNFVIFLDKKFNYHDNLFELLQKLYSLDIKNLKIQNFYENENKIYSFMDIDKLLLTDKKVKKDYELIKNQYKKEFDDNTGTFVLKFLNSKLGEVILTDFEENIKLIVFNQFACSNTITILIDQINEWQDFINYFKCETIFYYFNWHKIPLKNKNIEELKKEFVDAKNRGRICGKILAYILLSSKFFKDFQINLVGFSLGNIVVKHCIKELFKMNRIDKNNFVNLKNVIFIGAATHIKNKNKWKEYIEEVIINRFINCYSEADYILNNLYRECSNEKVIGNENLEINDDKGFNLVSNYNFTRNNFEQFSYNLGIVAEKIFKPYKDI